MGMLFRLITTGNGTLTVGDASLGMTIVIFAVMLMFFGLTAAGNSTLAVNFLSRMSVIISTMMGMTFCLFTAGNSTLTVC